VTPALPFRMPGGVGVVGVLVLAVAADEPHASC
jgi:hypothetical protein